MYDIYSIGEMVIDFIPGTEPASYIRNAGGAPANVAIAMRRNGLEAALCCKVGDDNFGIFLLDTLRKYGVKVICEKLCEEAITTMAFVTLAEGGERLFTFARKPGADMFLSPEEVKEEDIENSVIVHAGSCSLSAGMAVEATTKALRLGAEKGKLVSFDVNYRNLMWKDDIEACKKAVFDVLPYVDLLKISEEEAPMIGGVDAFRKVMKDFGITVLLETLGSAGARAYIGDEVVEIPGRKAHAVDATGAGDAFWGGFLSSLRIQGVEKKEDLTAEKLELAMRYGNVAGSICVQKKGAIDSLPTREEIEEILKAEA